MRGSACTTVAVDIRIAFEHAGCCHLQHGVFRRGVLIVIRHRRVVRARVTVTVTVAVLVAPAESLIVYVNVSCTDWPGLSACRTRGHQRIVEQFAPRLMITAAPRH